MGKIEYTWINAWYPNGELYIKKVRKKKEKLLKSRYLVVTKGLGEIWEAANFKEIDSQIKRLKKIRYKRPMVYERIE